LKESGLPLDIFFDTRVAMVAVFAMLQRCLCWLLTF